MRYFVVQKEVNYNFINQDANGNAVVNSLRCLKSRSDLWPPYARACGRQVMGSSLSDQGPDPDPVPRGPLVCQ